jgi:hypothetical protein
MPFIHWGREQGLKWKNKRLAKLQSWHNNGGGNSERLPDFHESGVPEDSPLLTFYTKMMADQLFQDTDKPLHLRRTLDQYYYTHLEDTSERDHDQIVSKHGPNRDGKDRVILHVDQLWLWLIGGGSWVHSAASSDHVDIFSQIP